MTTVKLTNHQLYIRKYLLKTVECLTLARFLRPHDDWLGSKKLTDAYKSYGHISVLNKLATLEEKRAYCQKYGDLSLEQMRNIIIEMSDDHILSMAVALAVEADERFSCMPCDPRDFDDIIVDAQQERNTLLEKLQ
jgi:hypothetical protein